MSVMTSNEEQNLCPYVASGRERRLLGYGFVRTPTQAESLLVVERCHVGASSSAKFVFLFGGFENLERTQQTFVDTHHRTSIVELAAIIRSTEKSD